MEYARKLVYCKNRKDTQEFFKMLRQKNTEDFQIIAKSTAKQTWDAEWHLIDGVMMFGYEVPLHSLLLGK